jgi:hypothetical protein
MQLTLGDDWLDLVDLAIYDARQPLFTKANAPFREHEGAELSKATELLDFTKSGNKVLTQGNAQLLNDYMQRLLQKKDVKVACIG